ncbi:hypothetical protein HPB47_021802 [Ixodes persulcatus]|uniref:Uncharacterized protein n=1 Tax=Ixodes persulcatus TaxID=34615 RepID=A0AC60QE29_IXOPE|nr:hypothetical protein HPB47_021802 [Ixodes persulcatus]
MSEPVDSCTSSGPGADPDSSQSSVRRGDDDDTANMETVALDTTDIYQELVQADEAGHDMSISLVATDYSFRDPNRSEVKLINFAFGSIGWRASTGLPLAAALVKFPRPLTPWRCVSISAPLTRSVQGTVEFHSAPVLEEVESIQASSEPPADARAASSADEGPSLSKFFSSDRSGGDQEGKAFFDVLAAEIAGGDKSRRSSGSASPLSMVQESCLIADAPPTDDGDLCAYDNWLPSAATREFLARLATSEPGTVFPDREHLTMPGIIVEEPQGDPVRALLQEHMAEEMVHRRTLTADDVPQNEEGLRQLLGAQCHNAAINLTTRLLTSVGQGLGAGGHPSRHSPHSLQLWYTRLALFVKLRKFALAEVEAEAFGDLDRPDLYYEFYPDSYPGKRGSMVPFAFRLLLAELPQFQGNHSTALNALYKLLNVVHHDFVVAIKVARILLEKNSGRKAQLYSAIGRIYLQASV